MLSDGAHLAELVGAERPTAVIDIGANPVDGDPPYAGMLRSGLCTVVGFEPQPEALAALRKRAGPHETYLPNIVGDGERHELRVAAASGMTSLLEPDPARLGLFNGFTEWGRVIERVDVETQRLDDIGAIAHMDLLKIDVQGAELMVFRGARERLHEAIAVHTEVSFVPLYHDQPPFGEIDLQLRRAGFVPHALVEIKRWPIAPVVYDGNFRKPMHQLLEADIVYARDIGRPQEMSDEQLRHLALVAHCVYGSSDLAHRCLLALSERGCVPASSAEDYLARAHSSVPDGG